MNVVTAMIRLRTSICFAVVLFPASALALAATTATASSSSMSACLPAALTATPRAVSAGGNVVLTSTGFTSPACRYRRGKHYRLTLGTVGRQPPRDLGVVSVSRRGKLRADVSIPMDASPGEAYIIVHGSGFDRCDDTRSSCAGYVTPLAKIAPSPG